MRLFVFEGTPDELRIAREVVGVEMADGSDHTEEAARPGRDETASSARPPHPRPPHTRGDTSSGMGRADPHAREAAPAPRRR